MMVRGSKDDINGNIELIIKFNLVIQFNEYKYRFLKTTYKSGKMQASYVQEYEKDAILSTSI